MIIWLKQPIIKNSVQKIKIKIYFANPVFLSYQTKILHKRYESSTISLVRLNKYRYNCILLRQNTKMPSAQYTGMKPVTEYERDRKD